MTRIVSQTVKFGLLCLLFLHGAFAFATVGKRYSTSSCANALVELQTQLEPSVGATDYYEAPDLHPRAQTVAPVEASSGNFGGQRIRLRKVGAKWISMFTTVQYDYQGDPRWFIETLGPEAAQYFGFAILSDAEMLVPDSIEFRGALLKLNAYLTQHSIDPIYISFYTPSSNDNIKVNEYLDLFADNAAIPIAPSGNHMLHDLSFHTGAIFLPREFLEMKQLTVKKLNEFSSIVEEKYRHDPEKLKAIRYYLYLLRMHETVSIDVATGVLTPSLVSDIRRQDELSDHSNFSGTSLMKLSNSGLTPYQYLLSLILDMDPKPISFEKEYEKFANREKLQKYKAVLPIKTVAADFQTLIAESDYDKAMWNQNAPASIIARIKLFRLKWCAEITARRKVLRDAILDLMRHSA